MIRKSLFSFIFGSSEASREHSSSAKRKRLHFETLENRQLLAVSFDPGIDYEYIPPKSAVSPEIGNNQGIFIADFNADGYGDILSWNYNGADIFLNQKGTSDIFKNKSTFTPVELLTSLNATVGDVYKDTGKVYPDLIAATCENNILTITAWKGLSTGGFSSTSQKTTVNLYTVLGLAARDGCAFEVSIQNLQVLNVVGDSNDDLICTLHYHYLSNTTVVESGERCIILTGKGDGTFGEIFMLDGLTDSAQPNGRKVYAYGNLYGTTMSIITQGADSKSLDIYTPTTNGKSATSSFTYTHNAPILGVTVGNVDADNQLELLIYTKENGINYISVVKFTGKSASTLIDKIRVDIDPISMAVGDLNNDQRPDILISNGVTYQVLTQKSDGKFNLESQIVTNADYITSVTGDFDGDGVQDVLLLGSQFATLIPGGKTADGKAIAPYTLIDFSKLGIVPRDFAFGDFNADGSVDIAVLAGVYGEELYIFSGTPKQTNKFSNPQRLAVQFGKQLLVGNFSGSAGDDIAVVCFSGVGVSFSTFISTPTGFQEQSKKSEPLAKTNLFDFVFAVGKVDSDGYDDIVAVCQSTATASILKSDGNGLFNFPTTQSSFLVGTAGKTKPVAVAIGDMNKDGRSDIVVLNVDEQGIRVATQNANGTFTLGSAVKVSSNIAINGGNCHTLALADFTGNGYLDVFVGMLDGTGAAAGQFIILENNTTNPGTFTVNTPINVTTFLKAELATLGLSIGFIDDNASPDVIIVGGNKAVRFRNKAEFGIGEISLVIRDYNSVKGDNKKEIDDLSTLSSRSYIDEWSCFQIEVWANTKTGNVGISEFTCVVQFNTGAFEVDVVGGQFVAEAGSAFGTFTCTVSGNLVTITGKVVGSELQGDNTNALLGRIAFIPAVNGNVPLNIDGNYVMPVDNGFSVVTASSSLKTTNGATSTLNAKKNTVPLFPVMFDINRNGELDAGDWDAFKECFQASSFASVNLAYQKYFYLFDANHSGNLDSGDWDIFKENYQAGMSRAKARKDKLSGAYYIDRYFPAQWQSSILSLSSPSSLSLSSLEPRGIESESPGVESMTQNVTIPLLATNTNVADTNAADTNAANSEMTADTAFMSYYSVSSVSYKKESSFFDELAATSNDVETLLKAGAL